MTAKVPFSGRKPRRRLAVRPAEACPGNRRWIQDYYDAMVLMPRAPTMLDARNAMIAADTARFGGANVDLLWLAFSERGFGQAAFTRPGGNDNDPIPDFSSPVHQNASLVFTAVAEDGSALPVNANIYVGDYEARATPVADTNPATAGPNLDNVVPIVPVMAYVHGNDKDRYRAYNFVANAPGYGHVRFKVDRSSRVRRGRSSSTSRRTTPRSSRARSRRETV